MKTDYRDVIEQAEWVLENLPRYKGAFKKKAYKAMMPEFNERFGTSMTPKQIKRRIEHYRERLNDPRKAYKHSIVSRRYRAEDVRAFYDWAVSRVMARPADWEREWKRLTGHALKYASITQRLLRYGYRWGGGGHRISFVGKHDKASVGHMSKRRNSRGAYVWWIKHRRYEDLTTEEKKAHVEHMADLENDPCWMRHDRYVLEQAGVEVGNRYVVHLNGDTLDDSIGNLYVTDNYWEYAALKRKGLCEVPCVVEACLEVKSLMRKVQENGGAGL